MADVSTGAAKSLDDTGDRRPDSAGAYGADARAFARPRLERADRSRVDPGGVAAVMQLVPNPLIIPIGLIIGVLVAAPVGPVNVLCV